jgi:hypothetical protein
MCPQTKGLERCVPDRCVLTLDRIQAVGNHTKNLGYPALGPSGVTQPSLTRRNVSPPPIKWIVRTLSKGTIVQGTQRSKRNIVHKERIVHELFLGDTSVGGESTMHRLFYTTNLNSYS